MRNSRSRALDSAAVITVISLLVVAVTPDLTETSDATVAGTYDVYIKSGQKWVTSYSYTSTLSPSASIKLTTSASEVSESTGWSVETTGSTSVACGGSGSTSASASLNLSTSNHTVNVSISVGALYTGTLFYVCCKLSTTNPSQTATSVFNVHVISPSFTSLYTGGAFYCGETIATQTPVLSTGCTGVSPAVTYSISNGSNNATLSDNTGLSFSTTTGAISGTVSKVTNSTVVYSVVATMKFPSGYPASQTVTTTVTLGTYSSASLEDVSVYAIKGVTNLSVSAPSSSGITYSVTGASCSKDGGSTSGVTLDRAVDGVTVASDGSVTGTPTATGVYVISENVKVVQTGQTAVRTVTVTSEDKITVSAASTAVNRYTGNCTAGTSIDTVYHNETDKVSGSWSISEGNSKGFFKMDDDGNLSVSTVPEPGAYSLTVRYTSNASGTNSDSVNISVYVDPLLTLSCSDSDSTIYGATSSKFLDDGQESATMSQTSTLFAGSKKVTYSITCSDGLVTGTDVSIGSNGKITLADSIDPSKIGSHTVTVTCTDSAVTANTASMNLTVVIVSAMSVTAPTVGTISSY